MSAPVGLLGALLMRPLSPERAFRMNGSLALVDPFGSDIPRRRENTIFGLRKRQKIGTNMGPIIWLSPGPKPRLVTVLDTDIQFIPATAYFFYHIERPFFNQTGQTAE